jgi:multimeric flavodoxin WrbA
MNITILNGSQSSKSFDSYLEALNQELQSRNQSVEMIDLRDLKLRYCTGCFGCWVKTPGTCSNPDDSGRMLEAVINSDFTLWAAPLRMGYPDETLKRALDKSIPLIHPYFEVVEGEAHHRPRYEHYPRLGLLVEREDDTNQQDLEIIRWILGRNALNMKSQLEFSLTTEVSPGELAERISRKTGSTVAIPRDLSPTRGVRITPPRSLTIFNGSPRGRKGNTPIMLTRFGEGFASAPDRAYKLLHLNRLNDLEEQVQAFQEADCVWLGFPLYTDAMPALVKRFIEALEPFKGHLDNPPLGFLVQSGFPEALHSRYVERYLEKLVSRLGSSYLGTIVKGGGEGVRMMPDGANRKLFSDLRGLGAGLAEKGSLDSKLLSRVAGLERYPGWMVPVMKALIKIPFYSWYWNSQLKKNGVFEERFAQPYQN